MPNMPIPRNARELMDDEYLEIRASLISIAAALDRLDRADGIVADDPRRQEIAQAIEIVARAGDHRARDVQLLFSRPYDENWKAMLVTKP